MPKRSKEWNEVLQKELCKPKFARTYIEAALIEGIPLQVVLGQVIRAMGVLEYSKRVGLAASNLHRLLRSKSNPTLGTLQMLLAPLGLQITVIEKELKYKQAA